MNDRNSSVAAQYSAYDVLERIMAGLAAMGETGERINPEVLKPVDEFHIGGAEATAHLLSGLDLKPGMHVLDIGSGIGGPARQIALRYGCNVTGVDLTPAFVEAASALTRLCGLDDKVRFQVGSATSLPFQAGTYNAATLLHVGMNIPDKPAIFREARRVLRDDGAFAVYDVMRIGDGELNFPVPWADSPAISFVATPDTYRNAADASGFQQVFEEDRRHIALEFFARIRAQASSAAPPPLGLHNLMGPQIASKMSNMIAAIEAEMIAPVEMIFRTA